jgi:hypothetical protein
VLGPSWRAESSSSFGIAAHTRPHPGECGLEPDHGPLPTTREVVKQDEGSVRPALGKSPFSQAWATASESGHRAWNVAGRRRSAWVTSTDHSPTIM